MDKLRTKLEKIIEDNPLEENENENETFSKKN